MVRAIIFSALVAFASSVYAAGSLVNINGGHHIGVNDINLQGLGQEAVDARGTVVRDVVQNVDVLGDHEFVDAPAAGTRPVRPTRPTRPAAPHEHGPECAHSHGLLGGLLKREEAASDAVKMAAAGPRRGGKNMRKNMRKNARKMRGRRH